jgi:uncharacterized membrane protein
MILESFNADIQLIVLNLNKTLTSICQLLALFVISVGIIRALIIFLKDLLFKSQTPEAFQRSRLAMGYSFSLGLSFLVGASILKTMISSRWDDIARLAAIIAVRTVLNYFLMQAINRSSQTETPASLEPVNDNLLVR